MHIKKKHYLIMKKTETIISIKDGQTKIDKYRVTAHSIFKEKKIFNIHKFSELSAQKSLAFSIIYKHNKINWIRCTFSA